MIKFVSFSYHYSFFLLSLSLSLSLCLSVCLSVCLSFILDRSILNSNERLRNGDGHRSVSIPVTRRTPKVTHTHTHTFKNQFPITIICNCFLLGLVNEEEEEDNEEGKQWAGFRKHQATEINALLPIWIGDGSFCLQTCSDAQSRLAGMFKMMSWNRRFYR